MHSKSSFTILSLLLLTLPGRAELRDPTRPGNLPSAPFKQEQVLTNQESLKLSAIWISQTSRRATINGKTIRQGQKLADNITVIKIAPHYVLVNHGGITKKLALIPTSNKTR